jgi:uncharacterized protein (DUF2267 family)
VDREAFMHQVMERLRCDEARAESLTFLVFRQLRERLTANEAAHVAAQLSARLRRLWQEGEQPDREVERSHAPEFVGRVRQQAGLPDDAEAERAVRAVFAVLQRALGSSTGKEGEAWDVLSQLPKDLKRLWMAAGEEPAE